MKTNRANITFFKNFFSALTKIKDTSRECNLYVVDKRTRAVTNRTRKINLNFYIDFVWSRRPTRSWIINVLYFYILYTIYYITRENVIQCEKYVIMSFEFSIRRYFNIVRGLLFRSLLCLLYLRTILKRE